MKQAFYIALLPTALVAIGYTLILRAMGLEPGYLRLAGLLAVLAVGFWRMRKSDEKTGTSV